MSLRLSGIDQRKASRDKQFLRRQNLALRLVKKYIDTDAIANANDPQLEFNKMWQIIENELSNNKNFQTQLGYVEGHNESVRSCQQLFEDNNLNIGFPTLIVVSKRPTTFRTDSWFTDGKEVLTFYLDWADALASKHAQLSLTDIMLTLIFHSAILRAPVLQAVLSYISDGCLTIKHIFGLPYISVIVHDESYHTNTYHEKEAVHQAHIFLSPTTAYLINKYLSQISNNGSNHSYIDIYHLYTSMQKTMKNYHVDSTISLKRFLLGAVYVLEDYLNLNLPEHTWYLVTGLETTYGLPISNWQALVYDICHQSQSIDTQVVVTSKSKFRTPVKSNTKVATEIAKLFKRSSSKKISKSKFTSELKVIYEDLVDSNAPLNEIAIVGWLLSKTDSCKVSSIRTYSNTITNRWLMITQGDDLNKFQEEDFESLYVELIELGSTEDAKNTIATYLDDIHSYLVKNHNIEPIAPLSSAKRPHHKTGYISEVMFQAILKNTDNLPITKDEIEAIKISLILGQRCGLRVGEIVKIKLKDVSAKSSYLEIRDNDYGNNKTGSALRRVLLELLLTESEWNLFKKIMIRRNKSRGDTLIATHSEAPFQANELSRILTSLIKSSTGLPYLTTHHLRHSCITNFQLMAFLFDDDYDFEDSHSYQQLLTLIPYDDNQAQKILDHFQTSLHYKKVFALAGLAGHASPATTFASYVHLTDIELGLILCHLNLRLTTAHSALLDVPRRKKHEIETNFNSINSYLIKKLKLPTLTKPKGAKNLGLISKRAMEAKKHSFEEVNQVLTAYLEKRDHQELMDIYEVDGNTFEQWLTNAKRLREDKVFQTKSGNLRLFAPDDTIGLLPPKDRYVDDRELMTKMTNTFRELYKKNKNRELLLKFVHHTLTHCQYHKNYISFSEWTDLADYIQIVEKLVIKKSLRLTVYNFAHADNKQKQKWHKVLLKLNSSQIKKIESEPSVGSDYQKKIRVELSLASQTEPIRLQGRSQSNLPIQQWTVRTLQIFCHYVFIMIGERVSIIDTKTNEDL